MTLVYRRFHRLATPILYSQLIVALEISSTVTTSAELPEPLPSWGPPSPPTDPFVYRIDPIGKDTAPSPLHIGNQTPFC
ncbi:hypothetical protein N657DRAFT_648529 [Parathielavia appendiculata]|uniref:Uncharacterized protein n=1 Tax=Parathielavia appendiculata TaxID=2587402 RepID=A0AAN6TU21_9PEZI|nr:hypothetical protein N657DRAFT_648529 [Parathielavia appendiculata]